MNTKTEAKTRETAQPPVARLRLGLLNASIWQRTSDDNVFYSVSFERRYRDAQGNWQSTHSYNADDLLLLAKLADRAHTEIIRHQNGEAD